MSLADIKEHEALTGQTWSVPLDATARFRAAYPDVTPAELAVRYLGRFTDRVQLARAMARQAYPAPGEVSERFAAIDFRTWPFSCIDWDAAAAQVEESLRAGTITRFGDDYFDAVDLTSAVPSHA